MPEDYKKSLMDRFEKQLEETKAAFRKTIEEMLKNFPSSDPKGEVIEPKIDIHEQEENYVLTVELPGLSKDHVSVKLEGNALVVSGEVAKEADKKNELGVVIKERWSGKFLRSIPIPKGTEPESIKAKLKDGVLTVTYPIPHPDSVEAIGQEINISDSD